MSGSPLNRGVTVTRHGHLSFRTFLSVSAADVDSKTANYILQLVSSIGNVNRKGQGVSHIIIIMSASTCNFTHGTFLIGL